MTTVSRFSRQNDAGLRALNIVLWENLVLVDVLVLESKALYLVRKNNLIRVTTPHSAAVPRQQRRRYPNQKQWE